MIIVLYRTCVRSSLARCTRVLWRAIVRTGMHPTKRKCRIAYTVQRLEGGFTVQCSTVPEQKKECKPRTCCRRCARHRRDENTFRACTRTPYHDMLHAHVPYSTWTSTKLRNCTYKMFFNFQLLITRLIFKILLWVHSAVKFTHISTHQIHLFI